MARQHTAPPTGNTLDQYRAAARGNGYTSYKHMIEGRSYYPSPRGPSEVPGEIAETTDRPVVESREQLTERPPGGGTHRPTSYPVRQNTTNYGSPSRYQGAVRHGQPSRASVQVPDYISINNISKPGRIQRQSAFDHDVDVSNASGSKVTSTANASGSRLTHIYNNSAFVYDQDIAHVKHDNHMRDDELATVSEETQQNLYLKRHSALPEYGRREGRPRSMDHGAPEERRKTVLGIREHRPTKEVYGSTNGATQQRRITEVIARQGERSFKEGPKSVLPKDMSPERTKRDRDAVTQGGRSPDRSRRPPTHPQGEPGVHKVVLREKKSRNEHRAGLYGRPHQHRSQENPLTFSPSQITHKVGVTQGYKPDRQAGPDARNFAPKIQRSETEAGSSSVATDTKQSAVPVRGRTVPSRHSEVIRVGVSSPSPVGESRVPRNDAPREGHGQVARTQGHAQLITKGPVMVHTSAIGGAEHPQTRVVRVGEQTWERLKRHIRHKSVYVVQQPDPRRKKEEKRRRQKPRTHFTLSLFTLCFCVSPLGLLAMVFAGRS